MSRRFEVSPEARADIADIRAYLRKHAGAAVASRVVTGIRDRLALIRRKPLAGVPRQMLGPDVRIVVSQRWVIYYETPEDQCRVLRVLDGARDRSAELLGYPEVGDDGGHAI